MEKLESKVKDKLGAKRYKHTLDVLETALKLGEIYNVPKEKIYTAALLHDYAKELRVDEAKILLDEHGLLAEKSATIDLNLIHGELASLIAMDQFGIKDIDVLNAIKYHTTGREAMSILEKIIYLADLIEPSREFHKLNSIREIAYTDLDRATLMAMDTTLEYLIEKEKEIDLDTIKARNSMIKVISEK